MQSHLCLNFHKPVVPEAHTWCMHMRIKIPRHCFWVSEPIHLIKRQNTNSGVNKWLLLMGRVTVQLIGLEVHQWYCAGQGLNLGSTPVVAFTSVYFFLGWGPDSCICSKGLEPWKKKKKVKHGKQIFAEAHLWKEHFWSRRWGRSCGLSVK